MDSELTRVALAVVVAVLVPVYAPWVSHRPWARGLTCALVLAVTLLPTSPSWPICVVAAVTVATTIVLPSDLKVVVPVVMAGSAAAVIVIDSGDAWAVVETVLEDNAVLIVAAGWIATVFAGGAIVGSTVSVFDPREPAGGSKDETVESEDTGSETPEGYPGAGRLIGWLERSLIFGFVVAGTPEAAAIVLAAKSIARFGSLDERRFAEYYLVGSLTSVLVALTGGIATRAALGESLF